MADGAGRAKTRVEVCRARWLRVLACGAAAAALVLLLLWAWGVYAFTPASGPPCLAPQPDPLPVRLACGWAGSLPWWALPGLVLGLCLLGSFRRPGFKVRFLRLTSLPVHPPLWVGAWGAGLLVVLAVDNVPGPWAWIRAALGPGLWEPFTLASLGLAPVLAWAACFAWAWREVEQRRNPAQPVPDARPGNPLPRTPEELMAWLDTDLPITRLEEDRLGHAAIARRMADRLCMDPPASQAVVGPLGSGKSSLGELVKDALRRKGKTRVRLVRVELWPYASVEAALRAILERALEELEAEAALPHLKRLPRHYVEGAMALGGFPAFCAFLLNGRQKTLQELIRELDDTARALDLRLVLWIEDLERFIGAANPKSDATELTFREQRELGPLRALVHAFGSAGNGHVVAVFATTQIQLFDLGKVARYIETLEVLRPEQMRGLLQAFLGWVQAEHSGILDVADPRPLGGALNQADDLHEALMEYLRREGRDMTTRGAKQGLRLARDFWRRFPGEVDLEDLVVVELLRNNEVWLEAQKQQAEANVDFKTLLNKVAPGDDPLMPRWWWLRQSHDEWQKPQAVLPFACMQRADSKRYWQRVLSEADIEVGDADQTRYRTVLKAAQEDDLEALLKMLEQPEDGEAVVACAWHLGFEKVLQLWEACLRRPSNGSWSRGLENSMLKLSRRLKRSDRSDAWNAKAFLDLLLRDMPGFALRYFSTAVALLNHGPFQQLVGNHEEQLAFLLWRHVVRDMGRHRNRLLGLVCRHEEHPDLIARAMVAVKPELWQSGETGFAAVSAQSGLVASDWRRFWSHLVSWAGSDPDTGLAVLLSLLLSKQADSMEPWIVPIPFMPRRNAVKKLLARPAGWNVEAHSGLQEWLLQCPPYLGHPDGWSFLRRWRNRPHTFVRRGRQGRR